MSLGKRLIVVFFCVWWIRINGLHLQGSDDLFLEHGSPRPENMKTLTPQTTFKHPSWVTTCDSIYLDVGSNIGVQIRKLFEPELYPNASVLKLFDESYGAFYDRRLKVCALGMEPHPGLQDRLQNLESAYMRNGWKVHFYPYAASDKEGTVNFHLCDGIGLGTCSHEVRSRLVKTPMYSRKEKHVQVRPVRSINLTAFIQSLPANTVRLMKLDVEGSEYPIVEQMASLNFMCKNIVGGAFIETHRAHGHKHDGARYIERLMQSQSCGSNPATSFIHMDDETYVDDGRPLPQQ